MLTEDECDECCGKERESKKGGGGRREGERVFSCDPHEQSGMDEGEDDIGNCGSEGSTEKAEFLYGGECEEDAEERRDEGGARDA